MVFSDKPGYMRETANDAVMERVDESGQLLGFSITLIPTSPAASPAPLPLADPNAAAESAGNHPAQRFASAPDRDKHSPPAHCPCCRRYTPAAPPRPRPFPA